MSTTAGGVKFILFIYLTIQSFEGVCVIVYKLCWPANIFAALFRIVHFLFHFNLAKLVIFRVRSLKIDRNHTRSYYKTSLDLFSLFWGLKTHSSYMNILWLTAHTKINISCPVVYT